MATIKSYTNSIGQITIITPCIMKTNVKGVDRPIAIRLTINPGKKIAFWEDTIHGHSIIYEECKINEEEIKIIASDNSIWTFQALTKSNFDLIKSHLTPMEKEFNSDLELQEYYSRTNFFI